MDRGTDRAIGESLRHEFAAGVCGVLVIAHRLLVLHEGRVAEFGTPEDPPHAGPG